LGVSFGLACLESRSLGEKLDHRESLATQALEVTQVFEVCLPQRIVGQVAREQHSVDMRVKQLAAEICQVEALHTILFSGS
jgi:hypothetical protein